MTMAQAGMMEVIPGAAVQRVQTGYTTAMAVQRPRDNAVIERRALQEAALLGEDAYYGWGAGKDRIEGPSKDLAMALVRSFGNCAIDLGEVQDTRDAWIFTATFVDLETGFTLARQFRQSKGWTIHGRFDDARKEDIRFQIGQSKAVRNVILNALPSWLVRKALDKAKGGVREKIEKLIADPKMGIEKLIDEVMKRLADLGVPEVRVLESFGRSVRAALSVEDLVVISGNIAALKAGTDTADSMFPIKAEEAKPDGPRSTGAAAIVDALEGQMDAALNKGNGPVTIGDAAHASVEEANERVKRMRANGAAASAAANGTENPAEPAPKEIKRTSAEIKAERDAGIRAKKGCAIGLDGCSSDISIDPATKRPLCSNHAKIGGGQ